MVYADDDLTVSLRRGICARCEHVRMYLDGPRCVKIVDPDRLTPDAVQMRRRLLAKDKTGCPCGRWLEVAT